MAPPTKVNPDPGAAADTPPPALGGETQDPGLGRDAPAAALGQDTDRDAAPPHPGEPGLEAPEPLRAPRRFASLLLVVGAAVALVTLLPHWPREREVELRLDDPRSITGLDVAWTEPGEANEAVHGGSWQFSAGAAPSSLKQTVRLRNGEYGLEITVARTTGTAVAKRTITLGEPDRITVPVR